MIYQWPINNTLTPTLKAQAQPTVSVVCLTNLLERCQSFWAPDSRGLGTRGLSEPYKLQFHPICVKGMKRLFLKLNYSRNTNTLLQMAEKAKYSAERSKRKWEGILDSSGSGRGAAEGADLGLKQSLRLHCSKPAWCLLLQARGRPDPARWTHRTLHTPCFYTHQVVLRGQR